MSAINPPKGVRTCHCGRPTLPGMETCETHSNTGPLIAALKVADRDKRHAQAELEDLQAYVKEQEEPRVFLPKGVDPWEGKCDPGCRGWGIFNKNLEIQRCDQCKRFRSDEDAAKFVQLWEKAEPMLYRLFQEYVRFQMEWDCLGNEALFVELNNLLVELETYNESREQTS